MVAVVYSGSVVHRLPATSLTSFDGIGPFMPIDSAGRVPAFLSSFVGRSRELDQLCQLLERGEARLLTLVGPGGSGKTRLAARIAQESAARYEDGLCWVSLDGLNDPAQVPQAVVAALGLVEAAPAPIELLVDGLHRRQLLLVLDNCEHLLDACARLVAVLLTNAPDLRLLATSRERLNVDGERVWPVPGLSVPQAETSNIAGEDGAATGALLDYDSVQLFVERATAAQPAFQLKKETEPAVRRICRQLDGLPLAVELAAARVLALGLAEIAAQLGERLDLLTGGPRTAPDRQRTLRATFDWSHDLLEPGEKRIFRRLGVFRGPFDLAGVQAVGGPAAGESGASMPAGAILEALTGLVEKSLVVREAAGEGRTVYRLLNMIRHYAEEKLAEAGEADAVREAHLTYYADLAIVAEPGLKGPEQRLWLEKLMLSGDNLRAALGWAISRAKADETGRYRLTAQRMANALFWFWNAADRFGEGRDWLERTLALFAPQGAARPICLVVAEGLRAAGTMAWLLGDMSAAAERLQESLAQCQRLEDDMNVAQAMMMLGRVHLYQGQATDALKMFEPSLAVFQEHDALFEQGLTLGGLSAGLAMIGDYDAAYSAAVECRDVFAVVGDPFFTGMALGDLGWAAYHKGRIAIAVGHLEEALALRRRVDSSWQTAQALVYLAEIYRYQGKAAQATTYLDEARALAEDIGAGVWLAHSARHLGLLAIEDARWEEATAYLLDGLRQSSRLENAASMVMVVEALALVAAAA
jgi:predicted ATPase